MRQQLPTDEAKLPPEIAHLIDRELQFLSGYLAKCIAKLDNENNKMKDRKINERQ